MHGRHVNHSKMFYLILLLPLLPRPAYQVCLPQYDYMVSTTFTTLPSNLPLWPFATICFLAIWLILYMILYALLHQIIHH